MKIKFQQFGGELHSWSQVGHNLARSFLKSGNQVDFCSTNGTKYFPSDLNNKLESELKNDYDLALSYTIPHNFPKYLSGAKARLGIWNYETTVVPPNLIKYWRFCDLLLPSSSFSKEIFVKSGWPENRMQTVLHGINLKEYKLDGQIFNLNTKKQYKILANIAQPHLRKNLSGLLNAFGKAFSNKDDVCLVLKIVIKPPRKPHDIDVNKLIACFKQQYTQHAEIEIISNYIEDISTLYRACDIIFSMTCGEGFWLPGLEAAALGKPAIVSNYGGHLDFLTQQNSFLIDGKMIRAPLEMQYLTPSPYASTFEPNVDNAVDLLRYVTGNYATVAAKLSPKLLQMAENLTWEKATEKIQSLI